MFHVKDPQRGKSFTLSPERRPGGGMTPCSPGAPISPGVAALADMCLFSPVSRAVLVRLEGCSHPVVMKGLCAECGQDLTQ